MGRKLRHLLMFLLIILKEPNMPEADCICAPYSRCVCSNQRLTSIPQDLTTSISDLDLRHNKISMIPPGIFANLTKLGMLDLSNNEITMVKENTFAKLPQLLTLILSFNLITTIQSEKAKSTSSHADIQVISNNCYNGTTAGSTVGFYFTGIPYGQFLRLRRICSSTPRFKEKAAEFRQHFQQRGYEEALLDDAITRAQERPREETLKEKGQAAPQERTVLVTTPSATTNHHQKILAPSATLHKNQGDIQRFTLFAYRRNKNIKDLLVRAQIPKEDKNLLKKFTPSGSFPCGRNKCSTCTHIKKINYFISHRTRERHTIRDHINCQSRNIVYLIQCKKCGLQYVGETKQTLANRLNGHRSSIKTKKDTPVSAHFNLTDHNIADLEVLGIEKLRYTGNEDTTRQRSLQRESYWIHQFRTLHPDGLNQESLEITRV
uniref:GIY-YIG domain-containing protein n=1 Tax=Branchiostoma floridae TaxID=7739 RepID=C3ZL08_BRAFL|eukprot:XP_002590679.1 hypothetical protein BRAFLDRAFT_89480 [Branchiostoma floridae]